MDNNTADERYLQSTPMLDFGHLAIQTLIQKRGWQTLDRTQCAQAVYLFVRDEILFGYNVDDNIAASRVLADGYGQCNTKGTLLMALLRVCRIPCRVHGFTIDKRLQQGAMSGFVYRSAPNNVFHSWVEIDLDGQWFDLEGFILDTAYLKALQCKFRPAPDGSFIGYGVATRNFMDPPVDFNGCSTYIQKEGINRDFGVYDNPDALLKEHHQEMSGLKRLAYRLIGRRLMNRNVNRIRRGHLPHSILH